MVTVCAWCQRFMGMKEPLHETVVTHGICTTCALRQQIGEMPTLVIARERAHTLAVFQGLLTGTPEIRVVVDRRRGERRRDSPAFDADGERRGRSDRRQRLIYFLV